MMQKRSGAGKHADLVVGSDHVESIERPQGTFRLTMRRTESREIVTANQSLRSLMHCVGIKRRGNAPGFACVERERCAAIDDPIFIVTGEARKARMKAIVNRLSQEVAAAVKKPDVIEWMKQSGLDPVGSSPEEHAAHIRAELVKWAKAIKDAKVQANN